ncbi:MAG TPA: ClbS/DfsB family four-helix bundle protein [Ktedonobacteraceae bacterium]|jgi:hypothetical protein
MSDPTNKAELLEQMQRGYTSFEALLASLSPEQRSVAGVSGEWAVKDILVHLTVWQTRVSVILEAIARHEEPALDPIDTDEKMNAFNDATFVANRARPLSEVEAEFRAAVERLRVNVEQAEEQDLFEPGRFAWLDGGMLWQNVASNTFEHYDEHRPALEEFYANAMPPQK